VLRKDNENDTLYIEDFASIHDTKKYKNPYYDEITSGYESLINMGQPFVQHSLYFDNQN
jgi:hypothetical protein